MVWKIREWRLRAGLDLWELSSVVGVSEERISSWERGFSIPDRSQVGKLCKIFQCKRSEITFGRDRNNNPQQIIDDLDKYITRMAMYSVWLEETLIEKGLGETVGDGCSAVVGNLRVNDCWYSPYEYIRSLSRPREDEEVHRAHMDVLDALEIDNYDVWPQNFRTSNYVPPFPLNSRKYIDAIIAHRMGFDSDEIRKTNPDFQVGEGVTGKQVFRD